MPNRLQPLNWYDMTAGLNSRASSFQLASNEVPEVLNLVLDPRGGCYTRHGWARWTSTEVGAAAWNPRNAFLHETAGGSQYVIVAVNGALYSSSGGAWSQITGATVAASPHLADFAAWGDSLYVACGAGQAAVRTTGTGAATALTGSGPTWQNDYTVGGSGFFPRADVACVHNDRMFVASTSEDSVSHPNRLRWSHPSNMEAWAEADFQDIGAGGTRITALVSVTNGLLVFKNDSVWLFYGSDEESFQIVNLTTSVGVASPQAVVSAERDVYFFSWPRGVFRITGDNMSIVSAAVEPLIEDVPAASASDVWLGWMNSRLWVGLPYGAASACLVFDPLLSRAGGWMLFQGSDGNGLGPFVERSHAGSDAPLLAFSRSAQVAMKLNATDAALDDFNGTPAGFSASIRTPWLSGDLPALRKSWRRPDVVLRNLDSDFLLTVESFVDFDPNTVDRSKSIPVSGDSGVANWGAFDWGDGTVYGAEGPRTEIVRGSGFGLARSLMVRFSAPAGTRWGLNAVTFKVMPRRLR